MKLIVISNGRTSPAEINIVVRLFEEGLEIFHLRKPKSSKKDIEDYIRQIPEQYRNRIVLHSHHRMAAKFGCKGIHVGRRHRKKKMRLWFRLKTLRMRIPNMVLCRSFNRLSKLMDNEKDYDYVFLSPVFDSITKRGHTAGFSSRKLEKVLQGINVPVIALGGVDATKVEEVHAMGFEGLAVWGALWENKGQELDIFREIQAKIKALPKHARAEEEIED